MSTDGNFEYAYTESRTVPRNETLKKSYCSKRSKFMTFSGMSGRRYERSSIRRVTFWILLVNQKYRPRQVSEIHYSGREGIVRGRKIRGQILRNSAMSFIFYSYFFAGSRFSTISIARISVHFPRTAPSGYSSAFTSSDRYSRSASVRGSFSRSVYPSVHTSHSRS